jgi:hypothetical protein
MGFKVLKVFSVNPSPFLLLLITEQDIINVLGSLQDHAYDEIKVKTSAGTILGR